MRKKLYGWHITLGRAAGLLLVVWALSGAAMIAEPLLCPLLDPPLPKIKAPSLDARALPQSPAEVVPSDLRVAAVVARTWKGRGWYEVTLADGTVQAFDARGGAAVSPTLQPEEVRGALTESLESAGWTVGPPQLLTDYDEHYRKGVLPVYRAALEGPGAYVIYVDARNGALEKKTTAWSRFFRWAGLGIHTWNLQSIRKDWDGGRRVLLVVLVALPIFVMAIMSYWLLLLRDRRATMSAASREASSPALSSRGAS